MTDEDDIYIQKLVLLQNQQLVAGVNQNKAIYIWSVNNKRLIQTLEADDLAEDPLMVGLKDGRLLCETPKGFRIWSYSTENGHKQQTGTAPPIREAITCITALQNGLLAIGTTSGFTGTAYIHVWDPEKGIVMGIHVGYGAINSIVEVKNGVLLSIYSCGLFQIWDLNTGRSQSVFEYHGQKGMVLLRDGSIMFFHSGHLEFSKTFR